MRRRHVSRTIFSIALVSLLAAACGDDDDTATSATTAPAAETTAAAAATTAAADTTAASAETTAGADTTAAAPSNLPATIKLVSVQDLSGPAGVPGQEAEKGMKVAIDEINSTGFLGSTQLELEVQDSATNPTTGASLFSQLVSSDIPLAFGSVSSGTAVAEAPVAQRGKLPTIFTQAGSPGIVDAGEYIYRATPVQSSYIHITGEYMQEQGYKKVAMIVATDIPTLVGLRESFTEMAGTYDYELVDVEETTSQATDLSSQLSKIVGAGPDAVVILGLAGQNPTVITQLRAAGYTGPIIGQQGMGGGVLAPIGAAAEGIVWATDFNPQQPGEGAQKFAALFEETTGAVANNFAAEGYDAVWFAARGLKAADSVDRDEVLQGLAQVADEGFEGALGSITFKDRDMIASGVLVTIKDGVETPVEG